MSYGSVKYDGYDGYYQDSQGWLEMGKMDILAPMLYGTSVQSYLNRFRILVEDFVAGSHGRHVYAGIPAGYDSFSEIETRIEIAREAGTQGQAIFSYSLVESKHYWDEFRDGPYAQPAQVPPMVWKASPTPIPTPTLVPTVDVPPSPTPQVTPTVELPPSPTPTPADPGEAPPSPTPTPADTGEVPPSVLPDLVVARMVIEPQVDMEPGPVTLTVVIENRADVDAQNGFWVELFVDPQAVPTINSIADQGALWYVAGLSAHETLSLDLEEADGRYRSFDGCFSTGRHKVYAYVDAYDSKGEVGLVSELDEANNLLGPLIVEIGPGSDESSPDSTSSVLGEILSLLLRGLDRFLAQLRAYEGSPQS